MLVLSGVLALASLVAFLCGVVEVVEISTARALVRISVLLSALALGALWLAVRQRRVLQTPTESTPTPRRLPVPAGPSDPFSPPPAQGWGAGTPPLAQGWGAGTPPPLPLTPAQSGPPLTPSPPAPPAVGSPPLGSPSPGSPAPVAPDLAPASVPPSPPSAAFDPDRPVVVNPDRGKYHRSDCPYARDRPGLYPSTTGEARAVGVGPCGICRPDA